MSVNWKRPTAAVNWKLLEGKTITRIGLFETGDRVDVMVDVQWEDPAPDGRIYVNKTAMNIYTFENKGGEDGKGKAS